MVASSAPARRLGQESAAMWWEKEGRGQKYFLHRFVLALDAINQ
jgi:hypothetical protein